MKKILIIAMLSFALGACSGPEGKVTAEFEGQFPLDFVGFSDFNFRFPVRIIDEDGIRDSEFEIKMYTLSNDLCSGIQDCGFVKKVQTRIREIGVSERQAVDYFYDSITFFYRKDGAWIKSIDSQGVECTSIKSEKVFGKIGESGITDREQCSDESSSEGKWKLHPYDGNLAELTSKFDYGSSSVSSVFLINSNGEVKGVAVYYEYDGATISGSSYDVKNTSI